MSGKAGPGEARRGVARPGWASHGSSGMARRGWARRGMARRGIARQTWRGARIRITRGAAASEWRMQPEIKALFDEDGRENT